MTETESLQQPVLVTGALGFIGRRLVGRLLSEGYQVITFDLPGQEIPDTWKAVQHQNQLQVLEGDISHQKDVESAVSKAKTVFHLAAVVGDWGGDELHNKVTVKGTEYVFKAALAHCCRVILASSIVVYGDQINKSVCHEGVQPGKTFGPYSRCKQTQEKLAHQYLDKGLEISIVRPANVYGAGSKPWVDDLIKELKAGRPALIGGGDMDAGLVHVDNVVELLMLVASRSDTVGEIYNASDDEGITWKQYMTELAAMIGAPKPRSIPKLAALGGATLLEKIWTWANISTRPPITHEALNLVSSYHRINIDKSRKQLGYKPVVSFNKGIEEIRSYLDQKVM